MEKLTLANNNMVKYQPVMYMNGYVVMRKIRSFYRLTP